MTAPRAEGSRNTGPSARVNLSLVGLLLLTVGMSCRGHVRAPAAEDTLVGTPAVVGTDRFNQVILKTDGTKRVVLAGPLAPLLANASGAEVWVAGRRQQDGSFSVSRFEVRRVGNTPVTDGRLELHAQQYELVTADGVHHTMNNVPELLRQHVGDRVWVSGALDKGPVMFGVIGRMP